MMPTRRTRIVCISDTHNQTPKLPAGDILIHAGDLTNQGTYSELRKATKWLQQADFKVKIVICGNHDVTCDIPFYQEHGKYFHNQDLEDPQQCIALLQSDPSVVYLKHKSKHIRFTREDGAVTSLKVFGSPYSPARGLWAFGYAPEEALGLWDKIPLDSDIVVTHTPAKFHRDECSERGTAGCEVLRETLWRVRPRLFVCGHVHEAYGVEVVEWDLSSLNVGFKEAEVRYWDDPQASTKKQYTVDISSRARSVALRNDGSVGDLVDTGQLPRVRGIEVDGPADDVLHVPEGRKATLPNPPEPCQPPFRDFEKAQIPISAEPERIHIKQLATRGHGGLASSARSDQEAISGREGRIESCIVNAAYMANNWPHKAGKRFHKPIVIDLELSTEPPPSPQARD
ncbi:Metallo-dependent phosphatase-like protein [Exophiala viscosa]|uniref:Metallo-dependent phosphatase-like protein n=1 Tax=Exophiala viscosa TaxID=2486360 RepID=A0AAN6DSP0_9EURO|nr:Metallo-dependent phosphatase-like protein [Exophiala viscosa]